MKPAPRQEAAADAGLARQLSAGLDALRLPLSAAVQARLLQYLALLAKWNGVYNLTAIRDPEQMLRQHLLDSLAIVQPLVQRAGGSPPARVFDVGSGGGLPGVVLAVVWPHSQVLLIEPVGKKAAFLRQCQAELQLPNLSVAACRVEQLPAASRLPVPDLIVCRAFASLADFTIAIAPLSGPETLVAAMKGQRPDDEIAQLPAGWTPTETLELQVPGLDAHRHLILLRQEAPADVPSGGPDLRA
ncbi:MAG: 16S rRNA (guanine(527)-N(7))-methyltransferase RsmG [Burkholderiaceae bacterium]